MMYPNARVPSLALSPLCHSAAFLLLFVLLLIPVVAIAQDGLGGQGNPPGQQQDPDDPGDPGNDDDEDGGSNSPEGEGSEPVFLTTSVSPARVPITSGTATITWEADNARYCTVDGVARATSGKITVGPWTTTGAKSILIECYNNGKAGYAADSVTVTVYGVPKPVITTTLSKSLLEANVDKFTVTYSATNAKSCMFAGTKYPTSGTATLGPYPAGKHSLTFSCSGDGGSTSHTINWEAITAVTLSSSVSPTTVKANGSETARVSWTGAHADSCTLDGATAAKSGSKDFGPYSYSEAGSKSATVACKNRLGSKTSTVNWTVNALAPSVSATLSQNPVVADVDTVNLSWTSSDSDYCSYGGSRRGVNGTVSNLGPFSAGNHAFTVSCTGTGGTTSDTVTLTAEEPAPPPTVTVSLDPTTITANTGISTLKWGSEHAASCSRDGTTIATGGTARVGPYSTPGTYNITVTCSGTGGSASDTAPLVVEPEPAARPTVSLNLRPATITAETGKSTLSWSSIGATSCSLNEDPVATTGSDSLGPYSQGTYTFTLNCSGTGGSASDSVILTVVPAPVVRVSLSSATVVADRETVEVSWSSTNATSCKFGSTDLPTSGDRTEGPFSAGDHELTISCTGAGGTVSQTVELTAVALPTVTASFSPATVVSHVGEATLTWTSTGATVCLLTDRGQLETSGSLSGFGPFFDGIYRFSVICENSIGAAVGTTAAVTAKASSTAENAPAAPENLKAAPNPSIDGNVTLTWDAPSSGTTPTGYLVYLGRGTNGPLAKSFSARSIKQLKLPVGSSEFNVFACSGTESKPDCGPAATITVSAPPPDSDGDGMPDSCETAFGFDPQDSTDGGNTDTDNDGVSNVDECVNGTDLRRRELLGFDDQYVAYGKPNSDDIYIARIYDNSVVPGVAGFYLKQSNEPTHFYNIVQRIDSKEAMDDGFNLEEHLSFDLEIVEMNMDGVPDLYIGGLENHVTGRSNVLIYGSKIPRGNVLGYTEFDKPFVQFLQEFGGFMANSSYFELKAEENGWFEKSNQEPDSIVSEDNQRRRYDYSNFNQDAYKFSLEIDSILKNGLSQNSEWISIIEGYYGIPGLFESLIDTRCFVVCTTADLPQPGEFGWNDLFWPVYVYIFLQMYDFTAAQDIIEHDLIDHFFHYTQSAAAKMIADTRILGRGIGTGYLTKSYYFNGRTARSELAICNFPINAYVLFVYSRQDGAFNQVVRGPGIVKPINCQNGEKLPGGGYEWTVATPAIPTGRVWSFDF